MIQLEYDKQSAGVRVSFVFCDGINSVMPDGLDTQVFCKQGQCVNGKWIIPQNPETLEVVKALLKRVIEDD